MSIILTLETEVKIEACEKERRSLWSDSKWFPEKKRDSAEEYKWETRAENVFNKVLPTNISARNDRKIATVQLRYSNHPGKIH